MATLDEDRLRRRLSRVEALHRGATTPGEREAAARARERLVARIVKVRQADPVARFCAEHVAALGVPPLRPEPPEAVPTAREVLSVLARWEAGDWTRSEVHKWACRIVDRVTLPEGAHDHGARVAEVLLQLAALHLVELSAADVPHARRFLRVGDWQAWFRHVAAAARRRRARRAS